MKCMHFFISGGMSYCLRGVLLGVTLSAVRVFASIDDTMPATIPAPIIADWKAQDGITGNDYGAAVASIIASLSSTYASMVQDGSTEEAYIKACHVRRFSRLLPLEQKIPAILYARHHDLGGPTAGFLDELNDLFSSGVQHTFGSKDSVVHAPGGALLTLEFNDCYPAPVLLIGDTAGCIRDPSVFRNADKITFAWNKGGHGYHIYEILTHKPDSIRQLTYDSAGVAVSDFEPCYLANGDILFNSTRYLGMNPVNGSLASNLYIMDKDGKYVRRLCQDLSNTFYPTENVADQSIQYMRWEYNDRTHLTSTGIFTMWHDGSVQYEYFGNQATWPAMILQGRIIPDRSERVLAIIGGYKGPYAGDLAIIDHRTSYSKPSAVQLIAPSRLNPLTFDTLNGVPDSAKLFQNPYPLNGSWFLISYRTARSAKFKVYLMNIDGKRELLAWDSTQSVSQAMPLVPRDYGAPPHYIVDYRDSAIGVTRILVANVYKGMAVDSTVQRGSIKKIRIVALESPVSPALGFTHSGSNAFSVTPVARFKGTRYVKRIVGETPVDTAGAAIVFVPPRTPFYIQLIDSMGCMVQSMRSWLSLQPGEKPNCVGCHEDKNGGERPPDRLAINPQPLISFHGIKDNFSYPKYVQPILDAKCISCHGVDSTAGGLNLKGDRIWAGDLNNPDNDSALKYWCKSYINLTDTTKKLVSYIDAFSSTEQLKPNTVGSRKSRLISKIRERSGGMANLQIDDSLVTILCAWIDLGIPHSGKYNSDMKAADSAKYEARLKRRTDLEAVELANIQAFMQAGGYGNVNYTSDIRYPGKDIAAKIDNNRDRFFKVRYSAMNRQLSIRLLSEGKIVVVDLAGRRIAAMKISREDYLIRPERTLSLRVPSGLYVVRFMGKKGTQERVVPIM